MEGWIRKHTNYLYQWNLVLIWSFEMILAVSHLHVLLWVSFSRVKTWLSSIPCLPPSSISVILHPVNLCICVCFYFVFVFAFVFFLLDMTWVSSILCLLPSISVICMLWISIWTRPQFCLTKIINTWLGRVTFWTFQDFEDLKHLSSTAWKDHQYSIL